MIGKCVAGETRAGCLRLRPSAQNWLGDRGNLQIFHEDDGVPRLVFPGRDNFHSFGSALYRWADIVCVNLFADLIAETEAEFLTLAGTSYKPSLIVASQGSIAGVGNSGAGEDDLFTESLPADLLAAAGDVLRFEALGKYPNANANTKRIRVRFGTAGTNLVFDSGALAITSAQNWVVRGSVQRVTDTTQIGYGAIITSFSSLEATATVETGLNQTLSGAITFKVTGESSGGTNNDVRGHSLVLWLDRL